VKIGENGRGGDERAITVGERANELCMQGAEALRGFDGVSDVTSHPSCWGPDRVLTVHEQLRRGHRSRPSGARRSAASGAGRPWSELSDRAAVASC